MGNDRSFYELYSDLVDRHQECKSKMVKVHQTAEAALAQSRVLPETEAILLLEEALGVIEKLSDGDA